MRKVNPELVEAVLTVLHVILKRTYDEARDGSARAIPSYELILREVNRHMEEIHNGKEI